MGFNFKVSVYRNTVGQKIKKSPGQKKLVKSNKSIWRNFFWPNSIFCNFKNDQISIFELGKSLKLPKMEFHFQFLIYLISRVNFLTRCARQGTTSENNVNFWSPDRHHCNGILFEEELRRSKKNITNMSKMKLLNNFHKNVETRYFLGLLVWVVVWAIKNHQKM